MRHLLFHAERAQHVAGLERGRGAGRSGRNRQALDAHHQRLALDMGEADVEVARDALVEVAVDVDLRQLGVQALEHALLQLLEALGLRVHFLHADLGGFAEAHTQRRRQRAGAETALLAAAVDHGDETYARLATDIERADALGSVNLVAGDAHQVDVHRLDIDRDLADGLGGIGMEESLLLAADLADLGQRLDDANLVVHRHDRHHHRLVGDGSAQLLEIDQAVLLHRQIGDREAFLLEMAAGIEHALVLGHGGDDVVLAVLVELRDAADGEIIRLGG